MGHLDVVKVRDQAARVQFAQDWLSYRGPMTPGVRSYGGTIVYVSANASLTVLADGKMLSGKAFAVSPYVQHSISSEDGFAAQFLLEAEAFSGLPEGSVTDLSEAIDFDEYDISAFESVQALALAGLEHVVGDWPVLRGLDPRIETVVECVRRKPFSKHSAEHYADEIGISVSHFSHLFTKEVGTSFRWFCAWKRVRHCIPVIRLEDSLVSAALACGYSDSSHLSHSIRQFLGFRPKDIYTVFKSDDFSLSIDEKIEDIISENMWNFDS